VLGWVMAAAAFLLDRRLRRGMPEPLTPAELADEPDREQRTR
jgi:hypothetical protein